MDHTPAPWHAALAWALVGEEVSLGSQPVPDVAGLLRDLDAAGWPRERIADHARTALVRGGPWPHTIPAPMRAGLGPAQLFAALGGVRRSLGLEVLETRPPSSRTRLDADERRLQADVPPHHGR